MQNKEDIARGSEVAKLEVTAIDCAVPSMKFAT